MNSVYTAHFSYILDNEEESCADELRAIVEKMIKEELPRGNGRFWMELNEFIEQYLDKTDKYFKLPKSCAEHFEKKCVNVYFCVLLSKYFLKGRKISFSFFINYVQ